MKYRSDMTFAEFKAWLRARVEEHRAAAIDRAVREFYSTGTPGGETPDGLKDLIDES